MDSATRTEVAEAMKLVKKIIGHERMFALAVMDRPIDPKLAPEMAIFGDVPTGMSPNSTKHTQHLSLIHISEPTRPY